MALPRPARPAARTRLRGVPRVHCGDGHPHARRARLDRPAVRRVRELREPAADCFRALAPAGTLGERRGWERQILEHQDRVLGCPVTETTRAHASEVEGAAGLLATEPFQRPNHAARGTLVCLEGRELALQTGAPFPSPDVADLGLLSRDEQLPLVR